MKSMLLAGTLLSAVAAAPAFAQTPAESGAELVTKASVGDAFEYQEAQMAEQRATDPRLKAFARKMIADHTDAQKKLDEAAKKAGDKPTATLDAPHQAMLDNLKTFNGTDFDKIYVADQIASHAATVALLSDYAQNGKNRDLSAWAKNALPVVKGHQADINAM